MAGDPGIDKAAQGLRRRDALTAERRPAWFLLDVRQIAAYVSPALAAAAVLAWTGTASSPSRALIFFGVAIASAVGLQLWNARRLAGMIDFIRRARAGQRSTPPLVTGVPDGLDRLSRELGELDGARRQEITRLTYERDRLGAVLAAMAEGVLVIDAKGTILRANERVREMFGLEGDDPVAGLPLWDVSRDVDFNALVREAVESGNATRREVELRGALERSLLVSIGATEDGSAWVLVLHDVTETKRLERMRTDFVAKRLARASDASHRDQGLRRDAALAGGRCRRAARAVPVDHRSTGCATDPPDR